MAGRAIGLGRLVGVGKVRDLQWQSVQESASWTDPFKASAVTSLSACAWQAAQSAAVGAASFSGSGGGRVGDRESQSARDDEDDGA